MIVDERERTITTYLSGTYTLTSRQASGFTCRRTYIHPSLPRLMPVRQIRIVASQANSKALFDVPTKQAESTRRVMAEGVAAASHGRV